MRRLNIALAFFAAFLLATPAAASTRIEFWPSTHGLLPGQRHSLGPARPPR